MNGRNSHVNRECKVKAMPSVVLLSFGPLACKLEDLILRDACKPHKRNNVDTDLTWFVAPLDCTAGAPCGMIAPLPSIHGIYNINSY